MDNWVELILLELHGLSEDSPVKPFENVTLAMIIETFEM